MPDLSFMIENNTYVIPPYGYTLDNNLGHRCTVAISSSGAFSSMYILGDVFLRNYVAQFDFSALTVSFAANVNAPNGSSSLTSTEDLLIIFGGLLMVVGIVALICSCNKKKKKKKRADSTDSERESSLVN